MHFFKDSHREQLKSVKMNLTIITEMSEQNKTNFHNDLLHEKDNESFELPDINMAFNAADIEEYIPSTSAAVANAPQFTISSCLRTVGRAKGGAQSVVFTFCLRKISFFFTLFFK